MTDPEPLPIYLDYSQFGMIRGPGPLPETVSTCEIGAFEHPDSDYTTYQIKILLAYRYFCMIFIFYMSGHYVKFYLEVHNANKGLPWRSMFYESVVLCAAFLCCVIFPGHQIAPLFQGSWFVGTPFIFIREWAMNSFGEIAHVCVYSFIVLLAAQYYQLKGQDKVPLWTQFPMWASIGVGVGFTFYFIAIIIGVILGLLPGLDLWMAIFYVRGISNKIETWYFVFCMIFFVIAKIRQKKDPAGYQVIRPYWPMIIYICIQVRNQLIDPNANAGLHKMTAFFEKDPWRCFDDQMYDYNYKPVIIGGKKYANSAGKGFFSSDMIVHIICTLTQVSMFFLGPAVMRGKMIQANLIQKIPNYYVYIHMVLLFFQCILPWHLPHREDFETYFRAFMIVIWSITAIFYLLKKEDHAFRSDWSIAGLLRFEERKASVGPVAAQIQFFLPVFISILSNCIFVISLITSELTPWREESGLQSGDILGRFDFSSGFLPKASVAGMYFFVCISYVVDHIMGSINVMFPLVGATSKFFPIVEKYRSFRGVMRYFLFVVGSMPALRLILSGAKCEEIDGNALPTLQVSKDVYCNYYGYHLAAILIGFFIATWLLGFNNLRYASQVEGTKKPFFARYPSSLIVENASALLLVAIRSFEPNGAVLAAIGLFLIILNLLFYLTQPTFLQDVRVIYLRCIAFSIIIVFYLSALFAHAGPNQWWPFVLLILLCPVAAAGTFYVARKKFSADERLLSIKERSDMIVRTLCIHQAGDDSEKADLSINLSDLSDNDMGAALCTDRLQMLMSIVLKRNDTDSWDNKDQLNLIKDLERGYMTALGSKSTAFDSRIITLLKPYLSPDAPAEFSSSAMRIIHRIWPGNVTEIYASIFDELLKLYCFCQDVEIHNLIVEVLSWCCHNDKFLCYNSDENNRTAFHNWALTKDKDGIFTWKIPSRSVHLIPYHLLKKFSFEPRLEFFHVALSFPPQLMWDFNHFDTFSQAAGIYIPQDKGVVKLDNVSQRNCDSDRPPVVNGRIWPVKYPKWRWILFNMEQIENENFDDLFTSQMYRFLQGVIPRYIGKEIKHEEAEVPTSTKDISPEEPNDNNVNEIELETVNSQ